MGTIGAIGTTPNFTRSLSESRKRVEHAMQIISGGGRVIDSSRASLAALGEKLAAEIRSVRQTAKNIGQGEAMVQTAEAAFASHRDILDRLSELAVQAAHAPLTDEDRKAISGETSQLVAEFERISKGTVYNGEQLSGSIKDIQVGPDQGDTLTIQVPEIDSASTAISGIDLSTTAAAVAAAGIIDKAQTTVSEARSFLAAQWHGLDAARSSANARLEAVAVSHNQIASGDIGYEASQLTMGKNQLRAGIKVQKADLSTRGLLIRLLG
ncbi:MAG: hypothetical protein H6707_04965 [Deltaproteobacteria bacterium]|nr:hypothetical protein [Deltaproteobacteria bacterium]